MPRGKGTYRKPGRPSKARKRTARKRAKKRKKK